MDEKKNSRQREQHRQRFESWTCQNGFWELSWAGLKQNGTAALTRGESRQLWQEELLFLERLWMGCSGRNPARSSCGRCTVFHVPQFCQILSGHRLSHRCGCDLNLWWNQEMAEPSETGLWLKQDNLTSGVGSSGSCAVQMTGKEEVMWKKRCGEQGKVREVKVVECQYEGALFTCVTWFLEPQQFDPLLIYMRRFREVKGLLAQGTKWWTLNFN